MKNETVLVTGGAGFIGSHMCEALLKLGYKVINIDNFNNYYDPMIKEKNVQSCLKSKYYKLVKGDILDVKLVKSIFEADRVDRVVHLAAMAGVRNSITDPLEYVDIDVKGTVNLLNISKEYGIKRFVFASSSSVYGVNTKLPFSEGDSVESQVSPYAAAKRCGEIYCKTYSSLYGLSIGCMRFFTVYGPRQRPEMAIHKFTRLIDQNKPVPVYGGGTSRRDYTYIEDIVDGLVKSMVTDYDFEIFNLGNNQTIKLNELVGIIGEKLGKKAVISRFEDQKGDVPVTCADIEKSKRILGYNPATDIETGVERFIKWYKKQ